MHIRVKADSLLIHFSVKSKKYMCVNRNNYFPNDLNSCMVTESRALDSAPDFCGASVGDSCAGNARRAFPPVTRSAHARSLHSGRNLHARPRSWRRTVTSVYLLLRTPSLSHHGDTGKQFPSSVDAGGKARIIWSDFPSVLLFISMFIMSFILLISILKV